MTAQLVELKDFSEGRGEMAETRKREELYRDVWREPMLQLAKKYGVSDVMLAKVCRKLHIPAPGRGYWARKASGQKLSVEPLPELKDVPVIQRFKLPEPESREPKIPEPEPADSEYLHIKEIETLKIAVDTNAPIHRLVAITIKAFKSATTDDRGFRTTGHKEGELDVRISPASLERDRNPECGDYHSRKVGISRKRPARCLSVEADFGKQLAWMRQQADRLDPLIESPKSILDRKKEIAQRW